MYSRLRFGAYGHLMFTCMVNIGSRMGDLPVSEITLFAILILASVIAGIPAADDARCKLTQVFAICSFGASAIGIVARSACPSFDWTVTSPSSRAATGKALNPLPTATRAGSNTLLPLRVPKALADLVRSARDFFMV